MVYVRSYDPSKSCRELVAEFLERIKRAIEGGSTVPPPSPPPPSPPPPPGPIVPPDAQPLVIGSNFKPDGVSLYADLFKGATWQNTKSNYDFVSAPVNAPADSFYYLNLPPPEASGEWHTMTWREPGNTTGVSQWSHRFVNAFEDFSGTRFADITKSYADGVFTARFHYFGEYVDRSPQPDDRRGRIHWRGSGTVELLDLREDSLPGAARFRPATLAIMAQLRGGIRALDLGGGNSWSQQWTWDQRALASPPSGYVSRQPSLPLEDWIAMANATDRGIDWVFTHLQSEDVVKRITRAFLFGEGMPGGIGLKASLPWVVELCDNEPWNGGLTGAYQDLQRIGYATGYVGGDGNSARLYAQAKRSQQVAQWIKEAAGNQMPRVVRCASLSPGNDAFDYEALKHYGLTLDSFEAVTQSIYMGIGVKNTRYGNNTPAELAEPWSGDSQRQVDAFFANRATYLADGKRHLSYEIGSDVAGNVMTPDEKLAWLTSPEFRAIYLREWRRLAALNGDRLNIYWDFGPYRQGGMGSWGHFQGVGQSNTKWDIVLQVQAEVDAAIG